MANTSTVCLHAWHTTPDGDQTYSDPTTDPVDGWCVYRRIDGHASAANPFEITDEDDFPDHQAAQKRAEHLAAEHDCQIHEY